MELKEVMEMTDFNEQVDEFQPAAEPIAAPAQPAAPIVTPATPAQPAAPKPPAAPEPAAPTNAGYDSIIQQQTEQINALIAQNQSLTNQITQLVQGGAQINTAQQAAQPAASPMQQFNPPALSDNDDWSLEALGREMAKGN